jgi:hypothetical protein
MRCQQKLHQDPCAWQAETAAHMQEWLTSPGLSGELKALNNT